MNNNSDSDNDGTWSDDEEMTSSFQCICNPTMTFQTLSAAIEYDAEHYQFNMLDYIAAMCTCTDTDNYDFYSVLKFVNFCRGRVDNIINNTCSISSINSLNSVSVGDVLKSDIQKLWESSSQAAVAEAHGDHSQHNNNDHDHEEENELYYKPVIECDGFLMNLEDVIAMAQARTAARKLTSLSNIHDETISTNTCSKEQQQQQHDEEIEDDEVDELRAQISALQSQLEDAKGLILAASRMSNQNQQYNDNDMNNDDDSEAVVVRGEVESKKHESVKPIVVDNDTYYFKGYAHYGIHELMLKDTVRTGAYENAICGNPHLFQGKTVLDVGCGTGVLSIFAARSGAKKVVSVDDSNIIYQARKIVEANGLDKIITLVRGKVEDVDLPLVKDEVDIIISEWMGYALFFETMLPSVLSARDRFMNSSGTMFPNACQIFIEGGSDSRLSYWKDVHGIDMSVMREPIEMELTSQAQVEKFAASNVVTDRAELIAYDLNTCLDAELDFEVPFTLNLRGIDPKKVDVLVISFDIDFTHNCIKPLSFSTGCQSTTTHWYQTVLWIEPRSAPILDDNEKLTGRFQMIRNITNPREIDFHLKWQVIDNDGRQRCDGSIRSKLGAGLG